MTRPVKWNEYELTEFFGALPEKDEDEFYLSFSIEKDGLRLCVTFFHYDFDVNLDVFRDGIDEPLLRANIMSSAGAKYISHENGFECLEIGASDKYIEYYGKEWIASMAVRLKVNPHICVELFRPAAV